MEVQYDAQTFLRQRTGGISRLFCELVYEFDTNPDLDVAAVLPFRLSNNALAADYLSHRGVRATPSWLPRGVMYLPWWLRGTYMLGSPDIVHHTYYASRFLGATSGCKQVTTIYDMIPELFAGTGHFTATHLAKRRYVEECDLVICISHSTQRDMEQIYGAIARRTVVVPLAVDSGFRPGLPRRPGLPSEYLLYVGKRAGYKDFGLMPKSLGYLRNEGLDTPLVVVGPPLTVDEHESFEREGVSDLVVVVSANDAELRQIYSNCSVLVQTSRYEGFGLTPLEGMASGVPVVVANASSMPEVGGDVAMYFEPGDSVGLADALAKCLSDTSLRSDLARRGVERATRFTTKAMAERTARAYKSLLDEGA